MPIYYAEAATFLTQASGKLDEGTIFFGCDGLDGILGEIADTADAENVMLLTPFSADDPNEAIQAFVATYEEQYGGTPNQFAAMVTTPSTPSRLPSSRPVLPAPTTPISTPNWLRPCWRSRWTA